MVCALASSGSSRALRTKQKLVIFDFVGAAEAKAANDLVGTDYAARTQIDSLEERLDALSFHFFPLVNEIYCPRARSSLSARQIPQRAEKSFLFLQKQRTRAARRQSS